jgi:hypothetical protein
MLVSQHKRLEKVETELRYGTYPSPTGDFPDDPRLDDNDEKDYEASDEKKTMSVYQ